MKRKVTAKSHLTSALLSSLVAGPASAGSVLIHEDPNHPNYIHPAFRINPERGKVAVQVSVNEFPGDYGIVERAFPVQRYPWYSLVTERDH